MGKIYFASVSHLAKSASDLIHITNEPTSYANIFIS